MKTQRNFGDKSGLGFKRKMTKGERKKDKEDEEATTIEVVSLHVLPVS